jgi:transcription termination/antitermination protein NusG
LAPEERSREEDMFDEFDEEVPGELEDDAYADVADAYADVADDYADVGDASEGDEYEGEDDEFEESDSPIGSAESDSEVGSGFDDEEFDETEIDESIDTSVGALPDLTLSPDAIFERFGLEAVEEAVEEKPAERVQQLPDLSFDDEAEVGVLPDPFADEEEKVRPDERAWFIIHCYSGYEHKVRHNLEQRIESMGMQDFIFQVVVPTVEEIELKDGKRRTVERCLYPGYLMVQMQLTDDSWYVVRNTPGVTGFVGMGNNPTPLRSEAVQRILRRMESTAPEVRATFKRTQKVRIVEGPFADFIGVVDDIDEERTKVRVLVSFFGRETPVELDFLQVERA